QDAGRIVGAGWLGVEGSEHMLIAGFNQDGTLDTSFGTNDGTGKRTGWITPQLQNVSRAWSIAIDSMTKDILVVGWSSMNESTDHSCAILRLTKDGDIVKSFGGQDTGYLLVPVNGQHTFGTGAAIDTQGNIVAAGFCGPKDHYDFFCIT